MFVLPLSLVVVGLVGILLSIPMLKDKVPRNNGYGFRTKLTLSCNEIWYPANRFAAKGLIGWGIVNVVAGMAAFGYLPLSPKAQLLLVIPPLSVVIPCVIAQIWVRRRFKAPCPGNTE